MRDFIVNLSEPREKRMLIEFFRGLDGPHRIDVRKFRPRRTDNQNRYYWGVVVEMFADWLTETQGEKVTPDEAHICLKGMFLKRPLVNRETGEQIGETMRSSASLTTEEFMEYMGKAVDFMQSFCGLEVPPPEKR